MNEEIEAKIQAVLPEMREQKHILHFSCGADSIATHIRMRSWGIEPELVYMYYIDGLPLVENYIKYYEKKMNCHIYKLPHPFFWKDYQNGLFQYPGVGDQIFKYVKSLGWGAYNFKTYNKVLETNFPDYYFAQGLRASDSINRRMVIKNHGIVIRNVWYPIASWGFNDIKSALADNDLKLPLDYALIGRSFEGLDCWMAPIIRRECPQTWEILKSYFPLLNMLCAQSEAMGNKIPNGMQRRMKIYENFVMDKGGLVW